MGPVVDIDVLKVEDHVDFVSVELHGLEDFFLVFDERHLAYAEGVVFFENLANALEILM
jgi:hypothetical protein